MRRKLPPAQRSLPPTRPLPLGDGHDDPSPWILLVDDDALVRRLIHTVLTAQGWAVKIADGADAAIALVNSTLTPPAVLLCDVMMPKIGGLDLSLQLLQRIPRLSVILISGHLAALNWWPAEFGRVRVLNKPFQNQDLIHHVQEALGTPV